MPKITNLTVEFISLVKRPATGKGLTLKNDQVVNLFEMRKSDDERQVAYGIVYAPDQVDSQGDEADANTIRKAAYEFMRESRLKSIDEEHNFKSTDAYVAESWLVRKNDPLFPDEAEGAWAVGIKITNPDLWQKLKSGDYTGLSLAGSATRKNEDNPPSWFTQFLKHFKPPIQPQMETKSMDEDEIRKLIQDELAKSQGAENQPAQAENPTQPAPPQVTKDDLENLRAELSAEIAKSTAKGESETAAPTKNEGSFM